MHLGLLYRKNQFSSGGNLKTKFGIEMNFDENVEISSGNSDLLWSGKEPCGECFPRTYVEYLRITLLKIWSIFLSGAGVFLHILQNF